MTTPELVVNEKLHTPPAAIPPLENGDQLTRAEFERRYAAMPQLKKAELIEGVVYMGSPVHLSHARPHARVLAWLGSYGAATPGVDWGDNATVHLDEDNEVQPDVFLRLEPKQGGKSQPSVDDYLEGAPELVVEIAASSVSIDMRHKLRVYRRNKVPEYIVWRVYDGQLDWFRWREGEYVRLIADAEGVIRSEVFSGLWLDVSAMLNGNLAQVLSVLQQGINTLAHAAFVEHLQTTSKG
jgi:Uma2 family endonuclease